MPSAGIARPERFFADLSAADWQVVGTMPFRDHHQFTQRDIERIAAAAKSTAAAIILTTDKDAVRFAACDLGEVPIAAVPLTATVEPADQFCAVAARTPPVKHRLEYVAARALVAIVGVMPASLVRASATLLGIAWYVVHRSRRRIAEANLAAAFPLRSASERRAIIRAAFAHFIGQAFETLKFSTLTHEQMLARVEFDGEERVRLAYAQGKGVLFITGHFGFWELHAIAHPIRFEPIGVLARALDNVRINTLLERIRQCTGNTVIYRQGTIRRVMRMLQGGHGVAVLIDQHIHGPDAVYVEFFERPRGDDIGRGGAGAADRRAGRAGVRAADRQGALPVDLRTSRRAAAGRRRRRGPGIHAALHRRARDVRQTPPRPLALDAPPLARRWSVVERGRWPTFFAALTGPRYGQRATSCRNSAWPPLPSAPRSRCPCSPLP